MQAYQGAPASQSFQCCKILLRVRQKNPVFKHYGQQGLISLMVSKLIHARRRWSLPKGCSLNFRHKRLNDTCWFQLPSTHLYDRMPVQEDRICYSEFARDRPFYANLLEKDQLSTVAAVSESQNSKSRNGIIAGTSGWSGQMSPALIQCLRWYKTAWMGCLHPLP